MWKAIRHRGGQSLVLVLISALVATCAAFAPLFSRSLDQALLRATLGRMDAADLKLGVLAARTQEAALTATEVEEQLPASLSQWYHPGISMMTASTDVVPVPGRKPSPVRLVARDDVCEHVTLSSGSCPADASGILVSDADAKAWGWTLGTTLPMGDEGGGPAPDTVVGTYTVADDPDYWLRTELQGKSGKVLDYGGDLVPGVDDFVVAPAALGPGWTDAQLSVDYRLKEALVTLDSLAAAGRAVEAISPPADASVVSPLPGIADTVVNGKRLVRQLVPLLIAQLVAVALAVLVLVAGAAVAQRRPEIAVFRLRGRSRDASRRLVMAELGLTVLLGLPVGVLLAVGLNELVRRFVLPPGVPFELGWLVLVAALVAGLASLAVVYAAARPVLREPIASLLRRVPPVTTARTLRVGDVLLVVLAAVGVVGIVTDQVSGPMAILTPTLLALAAGSLLGALVVVAATRLGRRALDGGALATALAGLAVARRPTTRHVLVVVTAVSALVIFAANAVSVADRNRENRAEVTVGAFAAVRIGSQDPTAVARVVDALPAGQREHAMPVGFVAQRDPDSTTTLAARPEQLRRIAFAPPAQAPLALDRLSLPDQEPVRLQGDRLTATAAYSLTPVGVGFGPRPPEVPVAEWVPPAVTGRPLRLGITVTTSEGDVLARDMGELPHTGTGTLAVDAPVLCPQGCRLQSVWVQLAQGTELEGVEGWVDLRGFAVDGVSLGIDDASGWRAPRPATTDQSGNSDNVVINPATGFPIEDRGPVIDSLTLAAAPSGGLRLAFTNTGRNAAVSRADAPEVVPALLAGRVPVGGTAQRFDIQNLAGRTTPASAEQEVAALPFVGPRGALVNLDLMLRVGGSLPAGGAMEMWIDEDFPGGVAGAERVLRGQGLEVLSTRTLTEERRLLDESATGWGLLLALFTATLSLLLAAVMLVVVAVTTGRIVTGDIAALRVAGVSGPDLRRAAVREAVAPVLVAAVVGALCGVAGSVLAMPLIPLFDTPAAVPALDLTPAWGVMAAAWLVALAVLTAVSVVLARRSARHGDTDRLREAW